MTEMSKDYWDTRIEYLKRTRALNLNDDYLRFLVRDVWKIDQPVHVIDFGCGYGYMGLKLLELLPQGSTYTGLDRGEKLIKEATELFSKLPYDATFTEVDINEYEPVRKYDLAVCHAFLMHMNDPLTTLNKMINSINCGGKVICFESNWISAMANQYYSGFEQSEGISLGILQRLFEMDITSTGKDGNIGIKLPQMMSELGLSQIECRVSDKVNYYDPKTKDESLYKSLSEDGIGGMPGEQISIIESLMNRGLSQQEAEQQYEKELFFASHFNKQGTEEHFVFAPTMKISFGTLPKK